jgi:DNA polymerase III subunit delta
MTPTAPPAEPVAPLHLVTGPEDLLADRAIDLIVAQARRSEPAIDVTTIDAERYQPGDLAAQLSPSLFGSGAVVVVRSIDIATDGLIQEARQLVEAGLDAADSVLVLRHRVGQKGKGLLDAARKAQAVIHECPKISSDGEKATFVTSEFRRLGRKVSPEAVAGLVEALGQDLRELAGACRQLVEDTVVDEPAGQKGRRGPDIDADLVRKYYGGRIEATGFAVADAALAGQTQQALGLLRHALAAKVDPVPLVAVLALGLRALAKVSSAGSARSGEAARDLGMAPWQVDKARRQLRGWTPAGLATAIEAVAEADLAVKGGGAVLGRRAGDPVYAVEKAVLTIGQAHGAH